MDRVIFHCDLNGFYASVECLYNPEIREKPVAVCGSVEERHGIVLAKNEVAKKFKIKTGEAIWQARQKCPDLVVVPPHMDKYLRFSRLAREIYEQYTDQIEAFGIDECWLDMTGCTCLFGDPAKVADEIRRKVRDELGITISIGVSWNKIFAKFGSDLKKPDAVTMIGRENYKERIWPLPAKELLYVGPSTYRKLMRYGIMTVGGIAGIDPAFLRTILGKWGEVLWVFANGLDNVPVAKSGAESTIKSIGNSMTTPRDIENSEDLWKVVFVLAESVCTRLRRHGLKGRTVQVSVKDKDLAYKEFQQGLAVPSCLTVELASSAMELLSRNWAWQKPIRAVGVRAANLVDQNSVVQLSLLWDDTRRQKFEALEKSVDRIRSRFGDRAIQHAVVLEDRLTGHQNPLYNTVHPVSYWK